MINQINRLAALAMENELLGALVGIRDEMNSQIDELRTRMRKIAEL